MKTRHAIASAMWAASTICCVVVLANDLNANSGPAVEQKVEPPAAPPPALVALEPRLKAVIQQVLPHATVEIRNSSGQSSLRAQYQVQPFMVHTIYRDGRIADKAHEEIGPNYEGFDLELTVQEGRYEGPLILGPNNGGQDLRRPYWTAYVNEYPLKGKNAHIWLVVKYGSRTNQDLLNSIRRVIADYAQQGA